MSSNFLTQIVFNCNEAGTTPQTNLQQKSGEKMSFNLCSFAKLSSQRVTGLKYGRYTVYCVLNARAAT